MNMNDLNEAFQLINDFGGDFEGEKDIALIEKAESALNLKFPPSYRVFLKTLGCGDIEGLEFYGLIDDNFESSSVPNAIWLTLHERKASGLPDHLVLIYGLDDGTLYAVDTKTTGLDGENPIVRYGADGVAEKVADSFGSFLLSELKTVL
ncbi:hypothetical protein BSQ33_19640 [Vibrio gazogenes]|uniref:Knr4/Smi1-like domain-containing protein n=2 Tax=Vibrio gazogenes TaxID=687 RepID=A0A1Z2SM69_VIBGA|nr:hypothetical protein BSQ33_19640 [Vibrio gazogenes]